MYRFKTLYKILLSFILFLCCISNSFSQQESLMENSMVQKFYVLNHQHLYWFSSGKNIKRAIEWLTVINSSDNLGIVPNKLQIDELRTALYNNNMIDSIKENIDKQITGMVLNYIKYLQQGNIYFEYDEVSVFRDTVYIYQLLNFENKELVSKIVSRLDCKDSDYVVLKKYLKDSITMEDTLKYKIVLLAMNYRRYLTMNHQSEYIIVNIPTAEAEYYRNDSLRIKMRTVMGKKINTTNIFASYITNIQTFPFWNVPRSIAVKEIIPKVQKNADYLEKNNFDVLDTNGNVMEDYELHWEDYSEKYFPYYFRQSTGADNALGVIKFDLKNPSSIFLHATSNPVVFSKEYRFLSHGCIRLEKPFELADALLRGKIDIEELKKGKNNTLSDTIKLPHKVPTFIIYMPVTVVGKKVTFFQDVYGLIK